MSDSPKIVLPDALEGLRELAFNFRFSWDPQSWALFEQLDPALWERTSHNPVRLLSEIEPVRLEAAARAEGFVADLERAVADLRSYLAASDTWYQRNHQDGAQARIAYMSAEFAVSECLRIYSGGLGVLAGDHLKSASDLGVPLVAVGLYYKEGYFRQHIDGAGRQADVYTAADPSLLPLTLEQRGGTRVVVEFPFLDRKVFAQIWRADVGRVPLYLLDTDIAENRPEDRSITNRLYGGDNEHRLRQEIVLGIGGMRALRALGIEPTVLHLNEGHAAFAAVERVRQFVNDRPGEFAGAAERIRGGVAFTTHTPVPAGHDFFPALLMERYLGGYVWEMREPWQRFLAIGKDDPADPDDPFNMTVVSLRLSGRRNGVSKLHGEVSRKMWHMVWPELREEDVPIGHITNGVHLASWVGAPMRRLYEEKLGRDWADNLDDFHWHRVDEISDHELWRVRNAQRNALVECARERLSHQLYLRGDDARWAGNALDPDALTIVFARRFATYKRATLLLSQPERLLNLLRSGKIQFVFAGKAHPRDEPGKDFLRRIFEFATRADARERFVFLEEYDPALARILTAGADVWLNVPRRPYEASGTSGMKASANGGLNLSIPDGWWAEAWTEHNRLAVPPGWSIDAHGPPDAQDHLDAEALFALLEGDVLPTFYQRDEHGLPHNWIARIRSSLRQHVPFFNTHRMVSEYVEQMYLPAHAHTLRVRADEEEAA